VVAIIDPPRSKPVLLGLTGKAGSGKDTIANILRQRGFAQHAFAQPLKRGIETIFGLPPSIWDDREAKEAPIDWLGKSPRYLAQTLGTEWGRHLVADDLWVTLAMRAWNEKKQSVNPRMVISDVRFDNEAQAIIDAGGQVWRVVRENITTTALDHISESGISRHLIFGNIFNDDSIPELEARIERWLPFLIQRYFS